MHKKLYASGFLYHLPSEQILLQQNTSSQNLSSPWLLFEKSYKEGELPEMVFKDMIADLLQISLDVVSPVYSYDDEHIQRNIVYSEIKDLLDFPPKNGFIFNWFSFKKVRGLQIMEQTRHDIVVSQRVIEAETRKRNGEHTFQ